MKNDTLIVHNKLQTSTGYLTLETADTKHLIIKNSDLIEIAGLSQDSLWVNSENSNVSISKHSSFSFLHFNSEKEIDLTFKDVNEFSLSKTETNWQVFGNIKEISRTIQDHSSLEIPQNTPSVDVETSATGKITYRSK